MKKLLKLSFFLFYYSLSVCAQNLPSNGFWLQKGYGRLIEVNDQIIRVFEVSKSSCVITDIIKAKDFLNSPYKFEDILIDTFTLSIDINKYYFKKVENNYPLCFERAKSKENNPLYNFQSLWDTFNENYSFFEERDINWKEIGKKYKSKISDTTAPERLYIILRDMLEELNDGHVFVTPSLKIQRKIRPENQINQKNDFDRHDYWKRLIGAHTKNFKSYNNGLINWGKINEDLVIIQINQMIGLSNYELSESLFSKKGIKSFNKKASKSSNFNQDEVNGAKYIMNKIFSEINPKSCIIDLRFNSGGFDTVALTLLSFFSDHSKIVFTKKARYLNGYTKPTSISVEKSPLISIPKVYLLTSHQTASAAEIFVLGSMNAISNIIRIGSNTEGVFSDILGKKLPNGWTYGLSNEIYQDCEGNSYENIGIEPDYLIDYPEDEMKFYDNLIKNDEAIKKVIELESILY